MERTTLSGSCSHRWGDLLLGNERCNHAQSQGNGVQDGNDNDDIDGLPAEVIGRGGRLCDCGAASSSWTQEQLPKSLRRVRLTVGLEW